MAGWFATLPLVGIVVARAYVRSRPAGAAVTMRVRATAGLVVFGTLFLAIGVAAAVRTQAAEDERAAAVLLCAAIGFAPLAGWQLTEATLRTVRRREQSRGGMASAGR